MNDSINHPAHYTGGKIECWDFIADQNLDFFRGNVVKYVVRSGKKGDEVEDLRKAEAYIRKAIALRDGGKHVKTVYVAHPFRGGEEENVKLISGILRMLDQNFPDWFFLSPIHSFAWLQNDHERALQLCRRLLAKADELWVFGDWKCSEGCTLEIEEAGRIGIPVKTAIFNGGKLFWTTSE